MATAENIEPDPGASYIDEIDALLAQAYDLPNSAAKIAILEQAIRIADTYNDIPLSYKCRQELVSAAALGGRPELVLIHFSWCVAKYDESPDSFDRDELYWRFKWFGIATNSFPTIQLPQVMNLLDDFKDRLQKSQLSPHPYLTTLARVYTDCGLLDELRDLLPRLALAARSHLSDCEACIDQLLIKMHLKLGQEDEALQALKELSDSGRVCVEVPLCSYPLFFNVWLNRGQSEVAAKHHKKTFAAICRNPKFLVPLSQHLEYLVAIEDWTKAAKAMRVGFDHWRNATSLRDRWYFLNELIPYLDKLTYRNTEFIRVQLPEDIPVPTQNGRCGVSVLRAWASSHRDEIGRQFDARNGNDHYSRRSKSLLPSPHIGTTEA